MSHIVIKFKEEIARSLKEKSLINGAYIEAAEGVLSSSQLEQFKAHLKKKLDSYETTMRSNAMRYGSSSTKGSTEKKSK